MKDWWKHEWAKTRAQLQENPRLRLGALAIPLIGLFYLNLLLADSRSERIDQVAQLQEQLLDAERLAGQDYWTERLDQARERLDEQRKSHFGSAESEAFARADIQASARQLIDAQRLEKIGIEVSTARQPDPQTGLIALQLRLTGNAQGEQLFNLVAALENAKPTYRIDALNVNAQRDQYLTFSLIASVWYTPWSTP